MENCAFGGAPRSCISTRFVYRMIPMMTLKEFLKEMGDEAASDLLDVPPRTVAAWRRGERLPRPIQAARIVLASKGVVDYAGIYAPAPSAPDARAT